MLWYFLWEAVSNTWEEKYHFHTSRKLVLTAAMGTVMETETAMEMGTEMGTEMEMEMEMGTAMATAMATGTGTATRDRQPATHRPVTRQLAILLAATALLAACTTAHSRTGAVRACPSVIEYAEDFRKRVANEIEELPERSAVVEMLRDYALMRKQARACREEPGGP